MPRLIDLGVKRIRRFVGRSPAPQVGDFSAHLDHPGAPPGDLARGLESKTGQAVRQAVLAEIERVYMRFVFRRPTATEVVRHLRCFYDRFPLLAAQQTAVREGNIRRYLEIRPLSMETDLTNQCNLRCVFCNFATDEWSKRKRDDISIEDFSRLAEQLFPLCHDVNFGNQTEPLLHPRFGDLLAIAHGYRVPRIGMTTNGLLLDEERIEQLISRGMENVSISIDAATKPTYERLRRKGNFDRLRANIRALARAKQRRNAQTPRLLLAFILMRSNIAELPAFVELAHELEIPAIQANHLCPDLGLAADEALSQQPDLCNRMMDQARALADRYQIALRLPANFDTPGTTDPLLQLGVSALAGRNGSAVANLPAAVDPSVLEPERRREKCFFDLPIAGDEDKTYCLFPWRYVVLTREGDVFPCGAWREDKMGNIFRQPFETIWNNARYRALRSNHVHKTYGKSCRNCSATMMGNVNNPGALEGIENAVRDRRAEVIELLRRARRAVRERRVEAIERLRRAHRRVCRRSISYAAVSRRIIRLVRRLARPLRRSS